MKKNESLIPFIKKIKKVGKFKPPSIFHEKTGKTFQIFFKNKDGYVEWINSDFEIRKSFEDNEIIGFTISESLFYKMLQASFKE